MEAGSSCGPAQASIIRCGPWLPGVASLLRLPRSLAHPVVLTFLVAAYFSYVTGDTVRAGYLLAVGLALSWDQARRHGPRRSPAGGRAGPGAGQVDPAVPAQIAFSGESADHRRAVMRRWLLPAVAAGLAYSVLVGSLQRYSWPATVAVIIPAAAGTGLNVLAHRSGSRIPTMGALFTRVMHSRTGRIAVVAWWAWLGLHLFSK